MNMGMSMQCCREVAGLTKTLFTVLSSLGLLLSILCLAPAAQAHPHNWIELESTLVLDEQGRLVELKQRWVFDDFYSMMVHADILNEYRSEAEGLKATAEEFVQNLKAYHYFSSLKLAEQTLELGMPSQAQLHAIEQQGRISLALEMRFKIASKPKLAAKALSLRVFDPTYYIAMNHINIDNIQVQASAGLECGKDLQVPEPSDELIEYAQSLDRSQRDTQGLGAMFAETVVIECI